MLLRIQTLIIIFFCLCVSGCAKTSLTLHLDLYKEDPIYVIPLTSAKAAAIYQGLDSAEKEANNLAQDRVALADQLVAAYEELVSLSAKASSPDMDSNTMNAQLKEQLAPLHNRLTEYKDRVSAKAGEVLTLSQGARTKISQYFQSTQSQRGNREKTMLEIQQIQALRDVSCVSQSLIELGGSLETSFEKGFMASWSDVADSINDTTLKTIMQQERMPNEFGALGATVSQLSQTIQEFRAHGRRIAEDIPTELSKAAAMINVQPKRAVDIIANVATAMPLSVGLGDRGATAVNRLTMSMDLLNSQIDRLQDPADPIWRVVSSPENESKWNTQFSETYFYSKGNSSVVIARDSPMSFRIQRGNNNPSALVQSQLQISRAIGNAAIAIAAASTGVPLSLPETGHPGDQPGISPGKEAEKLAWVKAALERQAVFRDQAVRNLMRNLISLKNDFMVIDFKKDPKGMKALLSRLEAVLVAHESVFTKLPENQDKFSLPKEIEL